MLRIILLLKQRRVKINLELPSWKETVLYIRRIYSHCIYVFCEWLFALYFMWVYCIFVKLLLIFLYVVHKVHVYFIVIIAKGLEIL